MVLVSQEATGTAEVAANAHIDRLIARYDREGGNAPDVLLLSRRLCLIVIELEARVKSLEALLPPK